MMPNMSSDRVNAYRVFQGEIQRIKMLKKMPVDNTKDDHMSPTEAMVIMYLSKRCDEMIEKGHKIGYDNAHDSGDDLIKLASTKEENKD